MTDQRDRREAYLAQAQQAEERAARATNPVVREGWVKVAEGYRYLAKRLPGGSKDDRA